MTPFQDRIRLLIVEDHSALAENLFEFFGEQRYILDFAPDGLTALHLVASNQYDVIILDVMLPGLTGFEVCRRLRQDLQCPTPVIFMTAKDQLEDKEHGFTLGADDYLVKPFKLRELELRINAIHRRQPGQSQTVQVKTPGVSFDPNNLRVQLENGMALELSGTAAKIFSVLIHAYPNAVTYEQLRSKVWGEREVDMNTLRTHVYALRKQLDDVFQISLIKTLHGRGYKLIAPKQDAS